MKITKRVLARLEMVYAVSAINVEGGTHFLAATESRGPCLLFSPPDWRVSTVFDGPGGCMDVKPIPRSRAFLAIQEFFPIFRSEGAGIVHAEAREAGSGQWHVHRVLDLPFVHRMEIVGAAGAHYLVASTLCGGKAFQDDWSVPGAVHAGPVPADPRDRWRLEPILQGLSKNHGLRAAVLNGDRVLLVCGAEGLFRIRVPKSPTAPWPSDLLIDHEVSDVCTSDIDRDGTVEIITIEPFHGNRLRIYKSLGRCWQPVFETAIDFGHVVWGGKIRGASAVIAGSRSGDGDLVLLRPEGRGTTAMNRAVIDRQVAPAQIAVVNEDGRDLIVSANHGSSEVALYEVT